MSELKVMVSIVEEPDPMDRTKTRRGLKVDAAWLVAGVPQNCEDRAVIMMALKVALDAAVQSVPFKAPDIVLAPKLVMPNGAPVN